MFKNDIEIIKNDLINSIIEICKYKSVSDYDKEIKYPFGIECNKALEYVLEKAKEFGFRTKTITNTR